MVLQQAARGSLVLALLVLGRALVAAGALAGTPANQAPGHVPQTVVIRVDGGLHWFDVGLGAAGTLATIALLYGFVLALRRNDSGDHERSYR